MSKELRATSSTSVTSGARALLVTTTPQQESYQHPGLERGWTNLCIRLVLWRLLLCTACPSSLVGDEKVMQCTNVTVFTYWSLLGYPCKKRLQCIKGWWNGKIWHPLRIFFSYHLMTPPPSIYGMFRSHANVIQGKITQQLYNLSSEVNFYICQHFIRVFQTCPTQGQLKPQLKPQLSLKLWIGTSKSGNYVKLRSKLR